MLRLLVKGDALAAAKSGFAKARFAGSGDARSELMPDLVPPMSLPGRGEPLSAFGLLESAEKATDQSALMCGLRPSDVSTPAKCRRALKLAAYRGGPEVISVRYVHGDVNHD